MVTPECPVLSGRGGLASLACPDMSCIVSSLEHRFILGAGAILWVLGISGAKKVGRGYSAGVKRYVQGGADRNGELDWDRVDGEVGGGSGGQRFGKHETRKVCVFIIRTALWRKSELYNKG